MIHIITAVHSRRSHNKVGIYILIMQALPSKVTLLFLTLRLLESPISSTGTMLVTIKCWLGIFQLRNKQILTEFLLARSECSGGLWKNRQCHALSCYQTNTIPNTESRSRSRSQWWGWWFPEEQVLYLCQQNGQFSMAIAKCQKQQHYGRSSLFGPLFPQCFLTSFVGHDFMYVYRCVRTSKEFP